VIGSLLAERYAKAFFKLALEQDLEERVSADMQGVASLIRESRELRIFLHAPVINPGKKEKILKEILGKTVHPLTLSFILLLVRKRREAHIPDITFEYLELYNEYHHIVRVLLRSPVAATEEIRREVSGVMKKFTDAEIVLEEKIEPDLIGGFVLNWKDNQYDASIRKQLSRLNRAVARINLYKKGI